VWRTFSLLKRQGRDELISMVVARGGGLQLDSKSLNEVQEKGLFSGVKKRDLILQRKPVKSEKWMSIKGGRRV